MARPRRFERPTPAFGVLQRAATKQAVMRESVTYSFDYKSSMPSSIARALGTDQRLGVAAAVDTYGV